MQRVFVYRIHRHSVFDRGSPSALALPPVADIKYTRLNKNIHSNGYI